MVAPSRRRSASVRFRWGARQAEPTVRVVLVDARAPHPQRVPVQEHGAVAPFSDLADAERGPVHRSPGLSLRDRGDPVEVALARLPQARLGDREAGLDLALAAGVEDVLTGVDRAPLLAARDHQRQADPLPLRREGPHAHHRLDAGRALEAPQPGHDPERLHVESVDPAQPDLALEPAEVPPAAGARARARRPPVGEVDAAAQRRDAHHQRVSPGAQAVEPELEREVAAAVGAERLAVQPHARMMVGTEEAHAPAIAVAEPGRRARLPALPRLRAELGRDPELLAIPAHRPAVLGVVARVPVVRQAAAYRRPAGEAPLGEVAPGEAHVRVVLPEVPGAAERVAAVLALVHVRAR